MSEFLTSAEYNAQTPKYMGQCHSLELDCRSAGQEIIRLLSTTNLHYRVHKSKPLDHILSHPNPVHTLTPYFL